MNTCVLLYEGERPLQARGCKARPQTGKWTEKKGQPWLWLWAEHSYVAWVISGAHPGHFPHNGIHHSMTHAYELQKKNYDLITTSNS